MKRGIIQSRGLGDIVIALPIARHYYDQGDEIYWCIDRTFVSHFKDTVPWVNWIGLEADGGAYYMQTPLQKYRELGCDLDECLNLYQFLSNVPEMTDPELFSILKFDQYKYWVSGVPFIKKWTLKDCITRNPEREARLKRRLVKGENYTVLHLNGSNFRANISTDWLDPAAQRIEITEQTDCVFDWLGILEGASAIVAVDSVIANLVDSLSISGPDLYWIRRSPWDLTPVLGSSWTIVPTNLDIVEYGGRVNPRELAEQKLAAINQQLAQQQRQQQSQQRRAATDNVQSMVPFDTNKKHIPTSFMSAIKQPARTPGETMAAMNQGRTEQQLNDSLDLYARLGVKY